MLSNVIYVYIIIYLHILIFLEDVIQAMRTAFNISDSKDIRIWNKYMSNTYELLTDTDSTIQDAELFDGQVIIKILFFHFNSTFL